MWHSFGHTTIKQLLEKQLERRAFPHAYLFVGPPGIGKKMVAEEMARQILGHGDTQSYGNPGPITRLDNHPDYVYFDAATSDMDGLRQFLRTLAHKPFAGRYKVAVIDNLDQANAQMGNALLKTLEEPSPSTILFAIAGQNNILPTIVSRCQMFIFNGLTSAELTEYAAGRKLSISEEILSASFGSPARLQSLVNDKTSAEYISAAVNQLEQAWTGSTAEKLLVVTALSGYETWELKNILLTWLYQLRRRLAQNPAQAETMSRICEALPHLNGSFNKKMVLQRLLMHAYEIA